MTHTRSQAAREDDTVTGAVEVEAVETLVLWPSGTGDVEAARDEADPWPVFVVVVPGTPAVGELSDLLGTPRSPLDTITNSHCWWSVENAQRAELRLAVRVLEPAVLALDVAVPAQCFLGLSDIVAAGATIGVTTRKHARRLTARVDDREALDEVVLLGGRTSSELGVLADLLCRTGKERA